MSGIYQPVRTVARILALRRSGRSVQAIAALVDRSPHTVRTVLRNHNLDPDGKRQ